MSVVRLTSEIMTILGFLLLGIWLQNVGTNTDFVGKFFTPLSLVIFGILFFSIKYVIFG